MTRLLPLLASQILQRRSMRQDSRPQTMITYQTSRYEYKYLITDQQADAIREDIALRLPLDHHSTLFPGGYHVRSLYLDSRDMHTYHQTMAGEKNRFKLRMRNYADASDSPVFLEIKRRVTQVVQKQRAAVLRCNAELLLRGASPSHAMLLNDTPAARAGLIEFCRLRDRLAATGKVFVDYRREAFQSPDGSQYRVTFDRQIQGRPYTPGNGLLMPELAARSKIPGVVLEMKFSKTPAAWMTMLAQKFLLRRTSVPKYIECVDAINRLNSVRLV